jgi:hypothetical protein
MWGEGAFAELQSLLPEGHIVAPQLQLDGSSIGEDGEGRVQTHFIASWGAAKLEPVREVVVSDLDGQRAWVRQREADLAYYMAAAREKDELEAEVERMSSEFAAWRRYIHELEGRLGLPLSGVERGTQAPQLPSGDTS